MRHSWNARRATCGPSSLLFAVFGLFACSLPASSATAPSLSPRDSFAIGVAAFQSGRTATARKALTDARDDSSAPAAWTAWFLGRAYLAVGETAAAVAELDAIPADALPRLRLDAVLLAARLETTETSPYRGIARLLSLGEDPALGARALYNAGALLDEKGDSPAALRVWRDLCRLYPLSPFAHKASLRLLESSGQAPDAYEVLAMARGAVAVEDFVTAEQALESLERRRVDRRVRDDILILHGNVLFRLSRYRDALTCYREAILIAGDEEQRSAAERGTALARLYLGDSGSRADALHSIERQGIVDELQERLETLAALMRVRGDSIGAREIRTVLARPSLEEFLAALASVPRPLWKDARHDSRVPLTTNAAWDSPAIRAAWRSALEEAERLPLGSDRALAFALLAERGFGREVDLWRTVISEAPGDALLERARRAIARSNAERGADTSGAHMRGDAREADGLLGAALRALGNGDKIDAVTRLRTLRYGYPGTPAAVEAVVLLERLNREWLGREPVENADLDAAALATGVRKRAEHLETARRLLEAGAFREAAWELEGVGGAKAARLRLRAYVSAGLTSDAVDAVEEFRSGGPWSIPRMELPDDFAAALFPLPDSLLIRAVSDSARVAPALIAALARVRTRFDPSWHEGFRYGIMALDAEAVGFANQFPDAPRMKPEELLDPQKSLALGAWLIRMLGETIGDSSPWRIAGTLEVGMGNAPALEPGMSPLEWIAHLPFRSARESTLDLLDALDLYAPLFARTRPVSATPSATSRAGARRTPSTLPVNPQPRRGRP